MTYREAIKYLESLINYEKIPAWPYKESLKLERIRDFLSTLDNPQESLRCIHIAGTKGKGSTCAFIAYILKHSGFRVGLYTSPHLSDFRERIRILCQVSSVKRQASSEFEGMISKRELTNLVEKLKPAIGKYNKKSQYGPLSFFEVYTSLAFVYFKEKKVDFVLLETGLGGRLDATNVVNPLVCVITPLSYEHTQKLGNTLREIAREKAGIIKRKAVVITAPQEKEAMEVIRNKCKEKDAALYEVNRYKNLKIKLIGKHQLINATVALAAVRALRFYNIKVDVGSVRKGLYNTLWPGRCEVISRNPLVILDGAQNVASVQVLKKAIRGNFSAESAVGGKGQKYKRLILVLGISSDKDIKGICNELYDLADKVILTKANNPRATEPKILAQYFSGKEVYITEKTKEAKTQARRLAKKEDLTLVTGSLFVVGEFRNVKV
jgi:dihydrofolate synthase/folylpolyglutamate synthase